MNSSRRPSSEPTKRPERQPANPSARGGPTSVVQVSRPDGPAIAVATTHALQPEAKKTAVMVSDSSDAGEAGTRTSDRAFPPIGGGL